MDSNKFVDSNQSKVITDIYSLIDMYQLDMKISHRD